MDSDNRLLLLVTDDVVVSSISCLIVAIFRNDVIVCNFNGVHLLAGIQLALL